MRRVDLANSLLLTAGGVTRLLDEQRTRLEEASAVELGFPHDFLARPMTQNVLRGDVKIAPRA